MSDVTAAEPQPEPQHSGRRSPTPVRSRPVKPGHLPVSEFASGRIGASAPFGRSDFPMPASRIYYSHPEPVPTRVLDDERH